MGTNSGESWLQRAYGLRQQGDLKGAVHCLRQCLLELPECAEAHFNLGTLLTMLGQLDEAVPHFRETIKLRPNFARGHYNLGAALLALSKIDESISHFTEALRLMPDYPEAHNCLASAYLDLGDMERARLHFRKTLSNNVHLPRSLMRLAANGLYTSAEPGIDQIRAWLAQPGIPIESASRLHFTLGYLLNDAGIWDEAFEHFREGNALWRSLLEKKGQAFDATANSQRIDKLIATFTPEYFQRIGGTGSASRLPVFIVGMPRSGTTLVEQILSHHPQVFGAGELPDMDRIVIELPARMNGAPYPECLGQLDTATAAHLAESYRARLAELGGPAEHVTDKLPENFFHIGLITTLFPQARIICCLRDPRDACLSCFFQFFNSVNFVWSLEDLGRYYRDFERLLAHWRAVLPAPMLEVVYEDLVSDQEKVSRSIVEFCGLGWDERCLKFHENRRPVRTLSATQVRRPLYTKSVGRWRHYAAHLGPLLDALGIPAPG